MKVIFKILTIASITLIFSSCSNNNNESDNKMSADEAFEKVGEIEEEVIGPNDVVSPTKLAELVAETEYFMQNYYNDKRVPDVTQKGIRAAVSLRQYKKAISMLDVLIRDYSTEETMPELLFQKAFIYSESGWTGESDKIYGKIISNYPNHPLAEQSKAAREMLTMSEEELLKKLESAQPVQ